MGYDTKYSQRSGVYGNKGVKGGEMKILQNALDRIKNNVEQYVNNTTKNCIKGNEIMVSEIADGEKCVYNENTANMANNIPSSFVSWNWIKKGDSYTYERDGYRYQYNIHVPHHARYAGMVYVPIELITRDMISTYSECGSSSLVYENFVCCEDKESLKGILNQILSHLN
jgi:hypothetical protein